MISWRQKKHVLANTTFYVVGATIKKHMRAQKKIQNVLRSCKFFWKQISCVYATYFCLLFVCFKNCRFLQTFARNLPAIQFLYTEQWQINIAFFIPDCAFNNRVHCACSLKKSTYEKFELIDYYWPTIHNPVIFLDCYPAAHQLLVSQTIVPKR